MANGRNPLRHPVFNLSCLGRTLSVLANFLTGFFVRNRQLLWHWHLSFWHLVLVYTRTSPGYVKPLSSEKVIPSKLQKRGETLHFGLKIVELYYLDSQGHCVSPP